jgi:hypothetical protein
MLNLIGSNRTSRAFRGAADDADRLAGRLDRAEKSSGSTSRAFTALTGRAATLAAGLLTVAPAAQAAAAAAVAGAGAMAAAYGSAAAAVGAFGLAAKGQLTGVSAVADAQKRAEDAVTKYGASSEQAAKAQELYNKELAKLPPATRDTAKAFLSLKKDYQAWSDSLAGDTMPVFTRGINVARKMLPKLTPLVKTAADALGDFMGEIERGTESKGFAGFMKRMNAAAKKSLPALLRSVKNVGVGIAGIFDAFFPHAGAMASGVEGLTKRFADWGRSLRTSESFKGFIDYVRRSLPALSTIFRNLVQIVVNLGEAFAPLSGISLQVVAGFTGILAALPPEVLRVLVQAFVGLRIAMAVLIPVQRALNLVMMMNPIGLVVIAIAALVAGLIVAYKRSETFRRVVQTVWAGVQQAVSTAWTRYIRPALQGLGGLFRKAYDTWQKWWPRLRETLDQILDYFRVDLLGTIGDIAEGFGKIGGKADEATGKIGGVGRGLESTKRDGNGFLSWSHIFGAGVGLAIAGPLGGLAGWVTVTFWPQMKRGFTDGFKHLGSRTKQFARDFPALVKSGLGNARKNTAGGLRALRTTFFSGLPPIRADWRSLWTWVDAFARRLIDRSKTAIRNGLAAMKRAFSSGVSAIRSAWAKLPDGVKRPINWVINVGYNRGIRNLWNKVMGWLKLPGGLQLGKVPALARGGTLDNPAPAKPFMTNKPTAIVGEGGRHPEYVIPTDPKYRGRAQALWAAAGGDLQMLAKGGVLGSVLGSVKKIAGKVTGIAKGGLGLLENPRGVWDRLASQMVPSSGHLAKDKWGTAMSRVVPSMLSRAWGAASQIISTFKKWFGGDGGAVVQAARKMIGRGDDRGENNNWLTRSWGMPGAPWCAMFVSEAIKQGRATKRYKGYPSAAVAAYAGAMRKVGSSEGRPGDLGAYRGSGPGGWGHINIIEKKLGGSTYQTIGGNEGPRVKRGTRSGPTVLRPMASGGVLGVWQQRNFDPADGRDPLLRSLRAGVFDSGGELAPRSVTLAINKSRRHEPIFPSYEAAAAYGGSDSPLVHIDEVVVRERADVDLLASRIGFAARAASF